MSGYYAEDFEVDDDGILRDTKSDGGIIIDDDGIVRDEGDRLSHQTLPDSGLGGERKSSTSTINYKLQGRHIPVTSYMDDSAPMEEKSLHISDLEDSQQSFSFDQASLGSRDRDVFRSENNLHTASEDMFSDLYQPDDLDRHFPGIYAEKLNHKELRGYEGDEEFDEPGILEEEFPPEDDDEDFPIYSPIASRHNSQKRVSQNNDVHDGDTLYLLPRHLSNDQGNSLLDFEQLEAHLKADSALVGTDEIDPIQQYLLGLEQQEAYEDSVSVSERSDVRSSSNRNNNDSQVDISELLQPTPSSHQTHTQPPHPSGHHGDHDTAGNFYRDRSSYRSRQDRELDKEVRQALSEAMFTEDEEEEDGESLGYGNLGGMGDTLGFGEAMSLLNSSSQNHSNLKSPPASRKSTPLPGSSRIPVYSRSPSPTRPVTKDKSPSNSRPNSRPRGSSPSRISSPTRIPSPTRGSARVSSPTRIPTPSRGQSPARNSNLIRPSTPTQASLATARGHSPTRAPSQTRTHSPTRIPTPNRMHSPTRIASPVRGKSPRVTSPVRESTLTRIPTPTRGLTHRHSKSMFSEDDKDGTYQNARNQSGGVRRRQLPMTRQRAVSPVLSNADPQHVPQRSDTPNTKRSHSPNLAVLRSRSPNVAATQRSQSPKVGNNVAPSLRSQSPKVGNNSTVSNSPTPHEQLQRLLLSPNAEEVEQITSQNPNRAVSPDASEENDLHAEQNNTRSERPNSKTMNQRAETDTPSMRVHRSRSADPVPNRTKSPALHTYLSRSPGPVSKRTMSPSLRGYMSPLSFGGGGGGVSDLVGARSSADFNNYNENSSLLTQSRIKSMGNHNKNAKSGVSDILEQNDSDEAVESEAGLKSQVVIKDGSRTVNGSNNKSDMLSYKLLGPASGRPDTPKSFKIRTQNSGALAKGPVKATLDTLPDSTFYESDDHSSHTSEKSRGELSARLRQEHQQRREANQLVHQLQQDYDELLAKHAGAELTIDQLRLEAKINLHMEPPPPAKSTVGSLSGAQHPQTINLGHSSRASVLGQGGARAQPQRAVVSGADGLGTDSGDRRVTMATTGTGPDGSFQQDGLVDNSLTATASAESVKMGLMFQSEGLREKLESFQILLQENQLSPEEQEKVYGNIKSEFEQLQNEYRQARDNHDMIRRQGMLTSGGTDAGFDDDKVLSGDLFQLERNLDEVHEHIEDKLRTNRSQRLPFQESVSASQTPVVSRAGTPRNATGSPSILDLMGREADPEIEGKVQQLHKNYGVLMERYQKLKERPPTPARDRDIDNLINNLRSVYEESPTDRKPQPVPPELDHRFREHEDTSAAVVQPHHNVSAVSIHSVRGANRTAPSPRNRNHRESDDSFVGEDESTFGAAASALPNHVKRDKKYPRRQLDDMDSSLNSPYQKGVVGTLDDMDSGYTEGSRYSESGRRKDPRRQSRVVRDELLYGEDSTDSLDVTIGQLQAGNRSHRQRPASGSVQSERSSSRRRSRKLRDSRRQSDPNGRANDMSLQDSGDSISEHSRSTETSTKVKTLESEVQNLQQRLASMRQSTQPSPTPYNNQAYQYPQAGAYSYDQYPGYQGYDNSQYTGHYPNQQPANSNQDYYSYYGNQNDGAYNDHQYSGHNGSGQYPSDHNGGGQYPYQHQPQQTDLYSQSNGHSYQNGQVQPGHENMYTAQPGQRSQTPTPHDESGHTPRRSLRRSHSFSGRPTHRRTDETYPQLQTHDDQTLRAPSRAHFYEEPLRRRTSSNVNVYNEPAPQAPSRAHFDSSEPDYETDRQADYTQTEVYSEYQSDPPAQRLHDNRDYYLGKKSRARSRERSTSGDRHHRSSSRGSRNRRNSPSRRYGNNDYYRLSYADEDYNQGAAPVSHQDRGYNQHYADQPVYYDRPQTIYYQAPYAAAAVPQTLPAAPVAQPHAVAAPVPVVSTSSTACPLCGGRGVHSHTDYVYPQQPQPATAAPPAGHVQYMAPASPHVSFAQPAHGESVPVIGQNAQPAVILVPKEPARRRRGSGGNVRYYVREYEDVDASPEPERRSRGLRRTQSLPRNSRRRSRHDDSEDTEDTDLESSLLDVTRTAEELKRLSQRMQHTLNDELDTSYRQAYHTRYL